MTSYYVLKDVFRDVLRVLGTPEMTPYVFRVAAKTSYYAFKDVLRFRHVTNDVLHRDAAMTSFDAFRDVEIHIKGT